MRRVIMTALAKSLSCLLIIGVSSTVFATTGLTVGPFDVTFYNRGEACPNAEFGTYIGDRDWTPQQIQDVQVALTAWDDIVDNSHVPGRQIKVRAVWDDFPSDQGWVYTYWSLGYSSSWSYTEHVWRDGHSDQNAYGHDIVLRVRLTPSWGVATGWNFGTGTPSPDQWDFRTIMLHEFGHPMGFMRSYRESFGDPWWSRAPLGWERLIVDDDGTRPSPGSFGYPGKFDLDGPQWWTGENANAVYGDRIPMHLPTAHVYTPEEGTSIMDRPNDWAGFVLREPTPLDIAFLQDLGWKTVPEPTTMTLLALGGISILRKRRPKASCRF